MRGFTLIEITLSVAILAGIVFGTVALFGAVTSGRAKTYVAQEVTANARIALAIIEQRIRLAESINTASSTFGVHPGSLSLSMTSGPTNPTVFYVSGQQLQLAEGATNITPLTSSQTLVSNLVFTNVSYPGTSGGARIDLTLQYNNPQNDPNYTFSRSYQTTIMTR